jgi:hypothetical protein
MTEREAKEKWCPFARSRDGLGGTENRRPDGAPIHRCLGAGCMAWRWFIVDGRLSTEGFCGCAGVHGAP